MIVPYVQQTRDNLSKPEMPALIIFDAFSGHQGVEIDILLEEHQLLSVKVPNGCTDELQPLDLSVNRSCKAFHRQKFSSWYAAEVAKQIDGGTVAEEVRVDTRLQVIRELCSQWLSGFYNYLQSRSEIVVNGFRKAGIISALEGTPFETDEDPFASDED